MPDIFGFETPDEARARVRERFRESSRQVTALGRNATPGQQVGASLANIFGGRVQRFIDTRAARKEATEKLMAEGLPEEVARAQAKEQVEPEFREVRRAQRMQDVKGETEDLISELAVTAGPDRALAVGMLHMANKLRGLGMSNEATQLSVQAGELLKQVEAEQAELDNLKARTQNTQRQTENIGKSTFVTNVEQRERLIGELATAETTEEKQSLERQLGALDAKIAKDSTIVGRSEFDLSVDAPFLRKQMSEIIDQGVLVNELNVAESALNNIDTLDASFWGKLGVKGLGFMETFFAKEPSESQKEFIDRVTKAQGATSLVAAQVRHALTGAQMSQFEIVYLEPFLPAPGDNKTRQLAKIKALRDYTELSIDARMAMIANKDLMKHFFDNRISIAGSSTTTPKGGEDDGSTTVDVGGKKVKIGQPRLRE